MKHRRCVLRRTRILPGIALSICLVISGNASASGLIDTMIQQLIKLGVFYEQLEKGYDIANAGLTNIGDIKQDDLNMHSSYFNSLETVKSSIKNYEKVGAIITMQLKILKDYKTFMTAFKNSKTFSSSEINYLSTVYTSLLTDLSSDLEDLASITTDRKLKMTDDERLNKIDQVYSKVSGQYDFFYSWSGEVNLQQQQRLSSLNEIQNIQKLYQP